jgi:hypothetical protein
MKTIKRAGSVIKITEFKAKKKEKFILDLIKKNEGNGYMRKGNFSSEIIWDGKSYMFPPKCSNNGYKKGLFLFGMVRKDAKAFLKSGNKIKINSKYPVNEYNDNFTQLEARMTGTDLNHAYWRIAYNLGIISTNTYIKGLDDDFKVVRLSALSTLGKGKDYFVIKDGKITEEVVKIGTNEDMDNLYKAIRQTCYKYMQVIKEKLKDDFICYRTDCVYYVDTKENRKVVRDYFKEQKMSYKQLTSIKKDSTRAEPF